MAWASPSGACAGKTLTYAGGLVVSLLTQMCYPSLDFLSPPPSLVVCILQRVLGPPVHPGAPAGAREQRVTVARSSEPVQSPGHLLLLLSDGDVHQGPGLSDRGATGPFLPAELHFRHWQLFSRIKALTLRFPPPAAKC